MTDLPLEHPALTGKRVAVRPGAFFRGSRLVVNGNPVKGRRGRHVLRNDRGEEIHMRFRGQWLDPVPVVEVGADRVHLVRPLRWYEYLWSSLPMCLIAVGGALGGLVAGLRSTRTFVFSAAIGGSRPDTR